MADLNYHHLRYFREVAHEGNLTRAAGRLNLSQSALSIQIKQLEERLGHPLFTRTGRQLILTEAGRIALDHADRIFGAGEELIATLRQTGEARQTLRIGAQSTLSRNFQLAFLRPALAAGETEIILRSGSNAVLLDALADLALDVVLTNEPPHRQDGLDLITHRLDEQPIGLYGTPARMNHPSLAAMLAHEPVILPSESTIRSGFDSLVARLGITARIVAEVDDMAMVRLLAREDIGLAIAPAVVLTDEIRAGLLQAAPFALDIVEGFYAVTARRNFPHPLLNTLLEA
ncbi:MAG: LysR family transcriptional regulator [Rhodobacterales bacterium]|nr:LysR family transcriptional regulator [Rhodobacterales bacterium]MDX5411721.1 LysR family transcriptional regulator [Rhodobacterales bacterium]